LVGKLVGAILVSWISFGMLLTVTAASLLVFGVRFDVLMLQYVLLKMVGLGLLAGVTLSLSTLMTPSAAATVSFLLAFGSSALTRALTMTSAENASLAPVSTALNWAVPQYGLFDLGGRVANAGWTPVPVWVVGALILYALIYLSAIVGISLTKFRRVSL
jgi:hypothetical protein